MKASFLACRLH